MLKTHCAAQMEVDVTQSFLSEMQPEVLSSTKLERRTVMDIRILGPAEVRHDGTAMALRGSKPRQLLVLLAINANRPVPADRLIEDLWEGNPPPSAASALRVHFGRVRRVLELDRQASAPSVRLPAGPNGYVLRLEPDELDSERFERRIVEARQASAEGNPGQAVPQLTEALDLWRGSPLIDVQDLSAARTEILRLEDLHALAFEELAEARLALGEHALVVDVLAAATKMYPLRERLTANLMIALYRCNRSADALAAYAELATCLDEQLGVTPSSALQKLEEDILLQRPGLDFVASRATAGLVLHPPAIRMIGRHQELRDLLDGPKNSENGGPRSSLVAGPAGIGKSTLIREFAMRLERDGQKVLTGFCELNPSEPYEPVSQVLRQLAEVSSPDVAPSETHERSPLEVSNKRHVLAMSEINGTRARFQLFEAVATWVSRHTQVPTTLIIEDLHWADRPTLLLLRHIARHPDLEHLRLLGTYRDDDIGEERLELIHSLVPPAYCHTIQLRPFLEAEARSLVQTTAPAESVAILAEHAGALCDATGGNPMFLRELLRELDESVKLATATDLLDVLSSIAPAGVRALVKRRMARLSPTGAEFACVAAVLDGEMSAELLAHVSALSPEAARSVIEECLANRLLVEDQFTFDRFRFPHALVRNAVYASMTERKRLELHGSVAQALVDVQDQGITTDSIARHFCEAAPLGFQDDAAKYSQLAGLEAEQHLMFSEAARWYEQAIHWLPMRSAEPLLGRLELALGRALVNDKQVDKANQAFLRSAEIARSIGDSALLIDVALAIDGPWISGSEVRIKALSLLQEALEKLDESDVGARVRALVHMTSVLYYVDPKREGDVVRQALALASDLHDPGAMATAQLALHRWLTHDVCAHRDRMAIARAACDSLALDGETGSLFLQHERELLADLLENGLLTEFQATLVQYEAHAKLLGSPPDIYWAMALRATEATLLGNLVQAEQLARGAALRGYELEQLSEGTLILQRFVIRYQQGRLAEEVPILREVSKVDTPFRAGAALMATALSEAGRQKRAAEVAWETLGPDGSALPRDVFWLSAVALFGGVAAHSRDRKLQDLLAGLLEPCADNVVVFGVGGAVLGAGHYWLGLLTSARGDNDVARDHYVQAKAIASRMSAPFWAAEADIGKANTLAARARGDDCDESLRLVQNAVVTAERFGFARVLREAESFAKCIARDGGGLEF